MGYPINLNPKKYEEIKEILEELSSLEPGQRAIANGFAHPSTTARVRRLLYEWLHLQGLTYKFRIEMDGDLLFIKRKDVGKFSLRKERKGLSPKLEKILHQMLGSPEPKELLEGTDLLPEEKEILERKYLEVTR